MHYRLKSSRSVQSKSPMLVRICHIGREDWDWAITMNIKSQSRDSTSVAKRNGLVYNSSVFGHMDVRGLNTMSNKGCGNKLFSKKSIAVLVFAALLCLTILLVVHSQGIVYEGCNSIQSIHENHGRWIATVELANSGQFDLLCPAELSVTDLIADEDLLYSMKFTYNKFWPDTGRLLWLDTSDIIDNRPD